MAASSGDRAKHWPAIEKRYGQPMAHWFQEMQEVEGAKYEEQIAFLRERHGFSQTHANALVMHTRGSTSSKRFATLDAYLADYDETTQTTVRAIIDAIRTKHPDIELVMAWNQPMLKNADGYVFGVMAGKNHVLIAPWGTRALAELAPRLTGFKVNKKTVQVPKDWAVDAALVQDLVAVRIAELAG